MEQRLNYLLQQISSAKATPEEYQEVLNMINSDNSDAVIIEINKFQLEQGILPKTPDSYNYDYWQGVVREVLAVDRSKDEEEMNDQEVALHRIRATHQWWAAAAIAILLLGSSVFYHYHHSGKEEIAVKQEMAHDVAAPSIAKATLTLANGTIVYIDSAKNGSLAIQGNINVVKSGNGQIQYSAGDKRQPAAAEYNTLRNPKGSKVITLSLADGSKVWLNAESSLKYPTAFTGNERKVEITGEAYFEVTHDASKPFIVTKGATSVQVLGTHFNVNTYDDENEIRVTLLEGSVKVQNGSNENIIKPGQQARVGKDSQIKVVNGVDIEEVIAWQKGLFVFDNTDLATIMREVSRWYDVEVVYDGKITDTKFGGGLSKNLPLSGVLKLMEANGVKFQLEGKVLRVIP